MNKTARDGPGTRPAGNYRRGRRLAQDEPRLKLILTCEAALSSGIVIPPTRWPDVRTRRAIWLLVDLAKSGAAIIGTFRTAVIIMRTGSALAAVVHLHRRTTFLACIRRTIFSATRIGSRAALCCFVV